MIFQGQLTAGHYRDIAAEIRQVAQRMLSAEPRAELLQLAKRYDRLAERAEAKQLK
jgi:hypothetical protein